MKKYLLIIILNIGKNLQRLVFYKKKKLKKMDFHLMYIYIKASRNISMNFILKLCLIIDKLHNEIIIKLKDNKNIIAAITNLDKFTITKIKT